MGGEPGPSVTCTPSVKALHVRHPSARRAFRMLRSQPLVDRCDEDGRLVADRRLVVSRGDGTVPPEAIDSALDRVALAVVDPGDPRRARTSLDEPSPFWASATTRTPTELDQALIGFAMEDHYQTLLVSRRHRAHFPGPGQSPSVSMARGLPGVPVRCSRAGCSGGVRSPGPTHSA